MQQGFYSFFWSCSTPCTVPVFYQQKIWLFKEPYRYEFCSVGDPGCLFQIPDPNFSGKIPDPHKRIEVFLIPNNCFKALGRMIRAVHPGSRIRIFFHPDTGSRVKKAPDPDQRCCSPDFLLEHHPGAALPLVLVLHLHQLLHLVL